MSPPYVSIKNLEKYQHYKHRNPPWVKLHYSILDDPAFLALDEVQQCRYIKLIMLASRQMNCISTDAEYLGRVMRISEQVDVTPLIDAGFLIASRKRQSNKMLAPPHENRSQSRVEKSRVEKRKEEPPKSPKGDDGFDLFWSTYNYKVSKGQAEKAWRKLKPSEGLQATIVAAITVLHTTEKWTKENGKFRQHPATWLNSKGWDDEVSAPPPPDPSYDITPTFTDEESADMCEHGWFHSPAFRVKHGDQAGHECGACEWKANKAAEKGALTP